MGQWSKMILLAMVAASVLGLPRPDEYNIPEVGNNRRSQYYVLHDDGSFKYGYDTGDDAFESQKTDSDGDVDGKFGYKDDEGQEFNIQYTSGRGGFVARGAHIPQVHPDVAAAFAARRNARPFVDPLADAEGDRSFDFDFDGEEYDRTEVSDSDGTVSGSYSYVDEFGNTKTYNYRAGKGIGFVIEGDDIPKQVEHTDVYRAAVAQHEAIAAAHRSGSVSAHRGAASSSSGSRFSTGSSFNVGTSQRVGSSHRTGSSHSTGSSQRTGSSHRAGTSHRTGSSHNVGVSHGSAASTKFSSSANVGSGSSVGSGHRSSSTRRTSHQTSIQKPAQTYFPPSVSSSSTVRASSTRNQQSFTNQRTVSRPQTFTSGSTRQFEAANTRTSFSPSGSYSLAYETSSHSRQESGDDDNNVRGQFTFTADDDDETRTLNYEAGSSTGFIAAGKHLPIGPSVPGAVSGQVTGRIEKVDEIEFVDPLADSDTDASFDFGFDSDTYSRTEEADEDGNVVGTYSVLGEDNILRTYRYRAGEGIGFETVEISAVPSTRRASSTSTRQQQTSSFSQGAVGSGAAAAVHRSRPSTTSHSSTSFSSSSRATSVGSHGAVSHKFGGGSSTRQGSGSHNFGVSSNTRAASSGSHGSRQTFTRDGSDERFTLRTYDPSEGRGKYGYVLRFDN